MLQSPCISLVLNWTQQSTPMWTTCPGLLHSSTLLQSPLLTAAVRHIKFSVLLSVVCDGWWIFMFLVWVLLSVVCGCWWIFTFLVSWTLPVTTGMWLVWGPTKNDIFFLNSNHNNHNSTTKQHYRNLTQTITQVRMRLLNWTSMANLEHLDGWFGTLR